MKFRIKKSEFEKDQKDRYSRINAKLFDVEEDNDTLVFNLSAKKLFLLFQDKYEEIMEEVKQTLKRLSEYNIEELVYSKELINDIIEKIKEMNIKESNVYLDENLNLIVPTHPKWNKVDYLLECWKNGRLIHPYFWRSDFDTITKFGFTFHISEEQKMLLNTLAEEERKKVSNAYVYPCSTGYVLLIHDILKNIRNNVLEKAKVKYHKLVSGGEEIEELYFIKPLTDISIIPSEYHNEIRELFEKGYVAYECFMFTLPSIILMLNNEKVYVNNVDSVYPKYESLNIEMGDVQLRDYQEEAIINWINNGAIGTISLPTGTGKTIIELKAIKLLNTSTLIIVPTEELLNQHYEFLINFLNIPKELIGKYYYKEKNIRPITIATYQSGHRKVEEEVEEENGNGEELDEEEKKMVEEISKITENFNFIILDEGHHSPAPQFQKIMINCKAPFRLSLTATPYREDKNEALIFLAMGDVVYNANYGDLAERKWVAPIQYNRIMCNLTDEEKEVLKLKAKQNVLSKDFYYNQYRIDELKKLILDKFNKLFYQDIKMKIKGKQTQRIRISEVVEFSVSKFKKLFEIVEKHKNDKVLIFTQRVFNAELIAGMLKEMGYNAEAIVGITNKYERAENFNKFKNGALNIIVSTTVLDEGIDVPDASVIIIFNASKTKRQMIQRIGRGCRYKEGKIEIVYELIGIDEEVLNDTHKDDIIKDLIRDYDKRIPLQAGAYYNDEEEYKRLALMELAKAIRRDVSDVINPDKMKMLIEKMKKEEVKD